MQIARLEKLKEKMTNHAPKTVVEEENPAEIEVFKSKLYVYGVDYMSTRNIYQYFGSNA